MRPKEIAYIAYIKEIRRHFRHFDTTLVDKMDWKDKKDSWRDNKDNADNDADNPDDCRLNFDFDLSSAMPLCLIHLGFHRIIFELSSNYLRIIFQVN